MGIGCRDSPGTRYTAPQNDVLHERAPMSIHVVQHRSDTNDMKRHERLSVLRMDNPHHPQNWKTFLARNRSSHLKTETRGDGAKESETGKLPGAGSLPAPWSSQKTSRFATCAMWAGSGLGFLFFFGGC